MKGQKWEKNELAEEKIRRFLGKCRILSNEKTGKISVFVLEYGQKEEIT